MIKIDKGSEFIFSNPIEINYLSIDINLDESEECYDLNINFKNKEVKNILFAVSKKECEEKAKEIQGMCFLFFKKLGIITKEDL